MVVDPGGARRKKNGAPSLADLVQGADQRLRSGSGQSDPAMKRLVSRRKREEQVPVSSAPPSTLIAWVIPGKRSVRDQLTLEQAARVHAAVRMLQRSDERPTVICFCGGDLAGGWASPFASPTTSNAGLEASKHVSAAALAYGFFRAAVEAQGISVEGISFIVEQRSTGVHDGIIFTAQACRTLRQSKGVAGASGVATGGGRRGGDPRGDGLQGPLLVRLFSTDHHLQRLHDIDTLTPRQSALQPLRELRARVEYSYVSYPYGSAVEPNTARRATRAMLASELQVLQLNLRGMLEDAEFLHLDIWDRLTFVRRRLSEDLLEVQYGPDLRPYPVIYDPSGGWPALASDQACDEAAEEAVALLGGVQAALREVSLDPIRSSLPPSQLRALKDDVVEAVRLLQLGDPDRPLKPFEWVSLVEQTEVSASEMVTAAMGATPL